MSRIVSLLPRRSDYSGISKNWRIDLIAGITVGIVALPFTWAQSTVRTVCGKTMTQSLCDDAYGRAPEI